jgi:hypothetical protein
MKKILVLVIILALIWAVPGARERIGGAALPVLDRLGPAGEWLATPVRNLKARGQTKFFLRQLRDDATEGRELPDAARFADWLQRRVPREEHDDPWGRPYWLNREGRAFSVGSDGADGVRGTDDDVVESATL